MDHKELCPCERAAIDAIVEGDEPQASVHQLTGHARESNPYNFTPPLPISRSKSRRLKLLASRRRRTTKEEAEFKRLVAEGLRSLEREELIEVWETSQDGSRLAGGPYVTFTPQGAHQIGAILVEPVDAKPRWQMVTHEDGDPYQEKGKSPVRHPHGVHIGRIRYPEAIEDRRKTPPEEAIDHEHEQALDSEGNPLTIHFRLKGTDLPIEVPVTIDPRMARCNGSRKRRGKS